MTMLCFLSTPGRERRVTFSLCALAEFNDAALAAFQISVRKKRGKTQIKNAKGKYTSQKKQNVKDLRAQEVAEKFARDIRRSVSGPRQHQPEPLLHTSLNS